uniref:Uncharacterized protein n=1 Tax=Arundo donax TaxID=35708 RepID=A0A0A8Z6H9_ARUDO
MLVLHSRSMDSKLVHQHDLGPSTITTTNPRCQRHQTV